MNRIMYSQLSDGKWEKRVYSLQCKHDVFLAGKCQGVVGHKGVHWSYSPSGNFCYSDNKEDSTEQQNGCAGFIPPCSKQYRTPQEMQELYYRKNYTTSIVTDQEEIDRLNRMEIKDNESIHRAVKNEDR